LKLISGDQAHYLYQSMLDLVPPYYCHLLAYIMLTNNETSSIDCLFDEEYLANIARNMLDNASQISYKCLLTTFAALDLS